MNRNDFLRMIENAGPADRHTIGEVTELIDIFPYFQSAYLLLLKGLSNTSDVKFENQLRISAMHIADREVLYYFLKKERKESGMPEISEKTQAATISAQEDSQQVVIELAKNSEDLINEIEKEDLLELETEETVFPPEELTREGERESEKDEIDLRKMQSELIDKFILDNPRIEPAKEKAETAHVDISKLFVEEKGEFVTETLAKIYVNQGYFSRAIEIYEKLCLKFPEKSSYFASQIEKVKGLLK